MTEQELITTFHTLSADARSVLATLADYATQAADVTFTLRDGASVTVAGIPKQEATMAAAMAATQADTGRRLSVMNYQICRGF